MNRLELDPCVEIELWEIWSFIARDSPGAATRVVEAAWSTFRKLTLNPGSGHFCNLRNPHLAGIRTRKVSGFPNNLIFYRVKEECVQILHVYHGARDLESLLE
jgi:plasmid stabilization system protein ParE